MMLKKSLLNTFAMIFILLSGAGVRAQSAGVEDYKFEAGGHFSALHSLVASEVDPGNVICIRSPCRVQNAIINSREFQPGLGARIGYNLTAHVALEAEVNFFPEADTFRVPEGFNGGHKIEGLFGVKAGKRFDKFGIFAKARPGFLYESKGDLRERRDVGCIAIFPAPAGCFETTGKNSFALDLGGVLEFYPSKRTIIRIDAGDTIVRVGERNVSATLNANPFGPLILPAPARPVSLPVLAETTHNFQCSIGVSFRF
jgi:hypothetical protein